MPVHTNYKPVEILWFLRNYWKYDRNRLIEEYQRHFQDSSFGKSQYTWLRARYGMKEEWGAVLNHPPYSGAIPGGTNTQYYEANSIPSSAPRPSFRRPSEDGSPTPQPAQDFAVPQASFHFTASPNMQTLLLPFTPHDNDGTGENTGYPTMPFMGPPAGSTMGQTMGQSMGQTMAPVMTSNMVSNMALYGGQAPLPGPNMGIGSLPCAAPAPSNSAPSPTGHVSGSHHTYSFPMPAGIFPYSAVSASMSGENLNMSNAMDLSMGMNMNMNTNMSTQALGYNMEPWGLGIQAQASYPQQQQQQLLSMPVHMQSYIPTTVPSGQMSFQASTPAPAYMASSFPGAPELNLQDPASALETTAPSMTGQDSPITTGHSKRKRSEFDIELREPQKRQMQVANPSDEALSGLGAALVAAALPAVAQNAQASNARKTTSGRRKKKPTPSRNTSIPDMEQTSVSPTTQAEPFAAPISSPALSNADSNPRSHSASQTNSRAASPTTPPITSIDPRGEWFDGTHSNCGINLRHRHDSSGGIYVVPSQPQSSAESSPTQEPETTVSLVLPTIEQAMATEPPVPTSTEPITDASFLYATPLSATDTSVADVDNTIAVVEEASAASPAATSLFGSPVSSPTIDSVAQVLTSSGPAHELIVQTLDQNALMSSTSTDMPELDGVWDSNLALTSLSDADLDSFWSTGLAPSPDDSDASPASDDNLDSATPVVPGPPSPASTVVATEVDTNQLQLSSNTLGMGDAEVGALLSEIQA